MAYEIEIKEETYAEIAAAYTYYEEQRIGPGNDFLIHLTTYFDTIAAHPEHSLKKENPTTKPLSNAFPTSSFTRS